MPCVHVDIFRDRGNYSAANGYGMKHDEANISYTSKANHKGFPSKVCNSLQLCIEPPHRSKVFVHGMVPNQRTYKYYTTFSGFK